MEAVSYLAVLAIGVVFGFKLGYDRGEKVNRPVADPSAPRPGGPRDDIDRDLR